MSRYGKSVIDSNTLEVRVADALRVSSYFDVNDRRERAMYLLRSFVTHIDALNLKYGNLEASLEATIAELDRRISEQLDRIMHAPDFVRLEASWRGLARLVHATEPFGVHVRLLDMKEAILRDSSALDALSPETDLWGGEPVTVIVNDFRMDDLFVRATRSPLLEGKAILVSSASPELLGLGRFAA